MAISGFKASQAARVASNSVEPLIVQQYKQKLAQTGQRAQSVSPSTRPVEKKVGEETVNVAKGVFDFLSGLIFVKPQAPTPIPKTVLSNIPVQKLPPTQVVGKPVPIRRPQPQVDAGAALPVQVQRPTAQNVTLPEPVQRLPLKEVPRTSLPSQVSSQVQVSTIRRVS